MTWSGRATLHRWQLKQAVEEADGLLIFTPEYNRSVPAVVKNAVDRLSRPHGGDMAADPESNVFHEVQLWVTTPAAHKVYPPEINSVQPGDKAIVDRGDHRIEVVTGTLDDAVSPLTTTQPTRVLHLTAERGAQVEVDGIDPGWNALVYVLRGSIRAADRLVRQFETVTYDDDGDRLAFAAGDAGAEVLVLTGLPTGEPIAMGGPWAVNTREELAQADADYRACVI